MRTHRCSRVRGQWSLCRAEQMREAQARRVGQEGQMWALRGLGDGPCLA